MLICYFNQDFKKNFMDLRLPIAYFTCQTGTPPCQTGTPPISANSINDVKLLNRKIVVKLSKLAYYNLVGDRAYTSEYTSKKSNFNIINLTIYTLRW